MPQRSRKPAGTTVAVAMVVAFSPVHFVFAQQSSQTPPPNAADTATQQAAPASDRIETVIVTAQKRKEEAGKVPLSMTVKREKDLAAEHIDSFQDLTRSIPNISFSGGSQGEGPGLNNIEIRGISSSAGSATVGIYMDEVSMSTRNLYTLGSTEPLFFDVDRIEVLRSPQGTLYGASSMGGTIKYVMNQPNLNDFGGSMGVEASHTAHGGPNGTATAVLNAPLIPGELAMRIGAQIGHMSGYINQVDPNTLAVVNAGTNTQDDAVLRLALKWMPAKNLIMTPALFYQQVKTGDIGTEYEASQTTGAALAPYETGKPVLEPGNDRLVMPSLTLNYDAGFADLTAVTAFFKRNVDRTMDGTQINSSYLAYLLSPAAPPALGSALAVTPGYVYFDSQIRQFSQELRIASKPYDPHGGNPITWLGGFYFSNQHATLNDNEPVPGINALFASFNLNPADPAILTGAFPNDFPGDTAWFSARHYQTTQGSLFGEINYHVTPVLQATVGLRDLYASDSLQREGAGFFTATPGVIMQPAQPVDSHAMTPKFAISWDITQRNMLYFSAAKGFRLGSENAAVPLSVCGAELNSLGLAAAPASFGPDSLWSYEIGDKARLFDNRLAVNTSLFYIDWNNIQVTRDLNCTFSFETNAGRARSTGIEIEMQAKPTRNVVLGFTGNYTNAYLLDSVPALGSLAGQDVPGVPHYGATISGEYKFNLNANGDGFARASYHWTGSSYGTPHEGDFDYRRPAYGVMDASVGARFENWELSLFAKNLLNNQAIIQSPQVQTFPEGYRLQPRIVGVNLNRKF